MSPHRLPGHPPSPWRQTVKPQPSPAEPEPQTTVPEPVRPAPTPPRTTQRPAERGELCTCGRQATVVILTERFGEVGSCGVADLGAGAPRPCVFCGAEEGHQAWQRCPRYTLRLPTAVVEDRVDDAIAELIERRREEAWRAAYNEA